MEKFAKLFETEDKGQILVVLDRNAFTFAEKKLDT